MLIILIEIKKIEKKTDSGIYISESLIERNQMSEVEGTLVACGDFAFYDLIVNNKFYPKIGDKVYFKRHSGILHYGDDDKVYRIINDQDIYASKEEEKLNNKEVTNG